MTLKLYTGPEEEVGGPIELEGFDWMVNRDRIFPADEIAPTRVSKIPDDLWSFRNIKFN